MRLLKPVPSFTGVGPNQQPVSNLAVGPTYDSFSLELYATTGGVTTLVPIASLATHVGYINVIADGVTIRRITPALLIAYLSEKNLLQALTDSAGTAIKSAIIPFTDPTRPTVDGQEATALGTVGIKQLLLQVELLAPAGYNYTLQGSSESRSAASAAKKFGFIETWTIESLALVNGTKDFNTISTTDDLLGLIVGSANVQKVQVTADSNVLFQATIQDVISARRQYRASVDVLSGTAPAMTGAFFPVTFDRSGQVTDLLPLAQRDATGKVTARVSDFVVTVTGTAAENVQALRRSLWRG